MQRTFVALGLLQYLLLAKLVPNTIFKLRQNGGFKSYGREGGFSRRSSPDRGKPAEQPVEETHLQGRRGAHYRHEMCHPATTGATAPECCWGEGVY